MTKAIKVEDAINTKKFIFDVRLNTIRFGQRLALAAPSSLLIHIEYFSVQLVTTLRVRPYN